MAVLRALKAKHGDSLILFADGATVLIDGGPSGVYKQTLRDELSLLEGEGDDPPKIDLLMVSHIDADHIDGVLDLTAELIEAREEEREPLVRIDRAWHNSFSDMIAKAGIQTSSSTKAASASVASAFEDLAGPGFDPHESQLVLSSVAQGRQLRLDLKALNVDLNKRFTDRVVLQNNANGPWSCGDLKLSVIGPTTAELDDLREEWAKQLKKILAKEDAAAKTSAVSLDKSVTNLASIVAIAEAGGKTALLTGDARSDMVLDWLKATGHLDGTGKAKFDIVKLGHHGSKRNVTPEFFEKVHADHYVISGDGGHGNPGPETLEMLFTARPALDYKVHLTYSPEEIKAHKTYIKKGNGPKLDAVLADPKRMAVLNVPRLGRILWISGFDGASVALYL